MQVWRAAGSRGVREGFSPRAGSRRGEEARRGPRRLWEVGSGRGSDMARPGPIVRVPEALGSEQRRDQNRPALWWDLLAAGSADGSCGVSQVDVVRIGG